ncbi:hypothetical protein T08_14257 [Trichinella sp. T8]|nr:hypothetical protein T08_14257 [Trichinella sp. T8]
MFSHIIQQKLRQLQIAAIVCGICEDFTIKVLYVVTGPYCTWWTCGHHVERPIGRFSIVHVLECSLRSQNNFPSTRLQVRGICT